MSFNIEEFKRRGVPGGGARPTQFVVQLNPPPVLGLNNVDNFRFVCKAAQIPPAIVQPINVMYFGRAIKLSGDREFPDWNVVVYNDADYFVRKTLESWSAAINTLVSNVMIPGVWPTGYKATAEVTQLRGDGEAIATYMMEGLWPNTVSPIGLDWEQANRIEEFEVTFSYDYWLAKSGDSLFRSSNEGTADEEITIPPPILRG